MCLWRRGDSKLSWVDDWFERVLVAAEVPGSVARGPDLELIPRGVSIAWRGDHPGRSYRQLASSIGRRLHKRQPASVRMLHVSLGGRRELIDARL